MLEPDDPRHGTTNGYRHHDCRCDACRLAHKEYGRLIRARKTAPLGFRNNGSPEVVRAEEFAPIFQKWVDDWYKERPPEHNMLNGRIRPMGAIEWLHQETGINPRRLGAILRCEIPNVPLHQVDLILTAMGRQVSGTEVEVIRNPAWSPEAWAKYMKSRGCY